MPKPVSRQQIKGDLRKLVEGDIRTAFLALGNVVASVSGDSARHGLEVTAFAFAALLDTYAKPNAENPKGMSDDPAAFRRYFAEIIAAGGR